MSEFLILFQSPFKVQNFGRENYFLVFLFRPVFFTMVTVGSSFMCLIWAFGYRRSMSLLILAESTSPYVFTSTIGLPSSSYVRENVYPEPISIFAGSKTNPQSSGRLSSMGLEASRFCFLSTMANHAKRRGRRSLKGLLSRNND